MKNYVHLLKNNTLSHSSSTEDVSLNGRDVVTLLILLQNYFATTVGLPYRPIFPGDGLHEAYEQHEYHKVYYRKELEIRPIRDKPDSLSNEKALHH